MANLRREGFRETLPSLKASDLAGRKETVVTIASADIVAGDKRKGNREKLLLMKFVEWPDRNYWPNSTSIGRLMKGVGEDTEQMKGKRVALKVVTVENPETHDEVEALHVAPLGEWDEMFNSFDEDEENAETKKPRGRPKNRK